MIDPSSIAQPEYPGGEGEIDNDAAMLCRVLAAEMRTHGTDPNAITPEDAWLRYTELWHLGVTRSGQQMPPEWEALLAEGTPLCVKFKEAWLQLARRRALTDMLHLSPGIVL